MGKAKQERRKPKMSKEERHKLKQQKKLDEMKRK
jgi:hypothetical protein